MNDRCVVTGLEVKTWILPHVSVNAFYKSWSVLWEVGRRKKSPKPDPKPPPNPLPPLGANSKASVKS